MTLLSQLTDDQFALASCGGALVAAFAVMTVSYHVGALVRRSGTKSADAHSVGRTGQLTSHAADDSHQAGRRAA